MNSPVDFNFSSTFKIDRNSSDPIYLQLAYQFINAIRSRLLEENDRLPGSRKLAEELKVHRNTITATLQELQAQGWLEIKPQIGAFVQHPEEEKENIQKKGINPPEKAPYSFKKDFILDSPLNEEEGNLQFNDGIPDYRLIPSQELVRFYSSALTRKNANNKGALYFRTQLSYYLNVTRKLHLSRNSVLPVPTFEQVLSIVSRLLLKTGDLVLVEELSHYLPNMIFSQAGAHIKTVPLDEGGMKVEHLKKHYKKGEIRFVYLRPRSQYPTNVRLSEERRQELIKLSEELDFILIEEDIDYELAAKTQKENTLLVSDGGNRVIHIGAFGLYLNPGFQHYFLIGPQDFLQEAEKHLQSFGPSDQMKLQALGEMIHQGDIHRYQRKANKVSAERREHFTMLLKDRFKEEISVSKVSVLASWVEFKRAISLSQLQRNAKEKGLIIPSVCMYQDRKVTGLRLGFAHLSLVEMEEAVGVLWKVYRGT